MRKKIYPLSLLFILIITVVRLSAADYLIPEEDPVYPFLQRMEIRGFLNEPLSGVRPWTRNEVIPLLNYLSEHSHRLSEKERAILRMIISRFAPDYRFQQFMDNGKTGWQTPLRNPVDVNEWLAAPTGTDVMPLLGYQDSSQMILAEVDGLFRAESKNDLFRFSGHIRMRAFWQNNGFSIYGDATAYRLFVRDGFRDEPVDGRGHYLHADSVGSLVSFDNTTGYMQYTGSAGRFFLGNTNTVWGFGNASLFLSGNAPNFANILWQKKFSGVSVTAIHASLMNASFTQDALTLRKIYPEKYLAGHRMEISPVRNLTLAFTEFIVYGGRNPELTYMIPFSFLWSSEHNLEDRDNSLLGFSLKWRPLRGISISAALLLDEFKFSEISSDWWANKRGYQAGIRAALPFVCPTDFYAEWTLVRPWTYTHYVDFNTFTHKGICLGFEAGPNSAQISTGIEGWAGASHRFRAGVKILKHGNDPMDISDPGWYPVGGDANQNYNLRNKDYDYSTENLTGDIATYINPDIMWEWQLRSKIYLKAEYCPRVTDDRTDHFGILHLQVIR